MLLAKRYPPVCSPPGGPYNTVCFPSGGVTCPCYANYNVSCQCHTVFGTNVNGSCRPYPDPDTACYVAGSAYPYCCK
ncbi:unnamed protein product [Rotaria sp. Silwood1]|nr:unnamed protein product [Rotaria sp. Silwood1]